MNTETVNNEAYGTIFAKLSVPTVKTVDDVKTFINIKSNKYIPSKKITVKTKNQSRSIEDSYAPYRGEKLGSHYVSLKNLWQFDLQTKPGFVNSSDSYMIDDTFDKITCPSCEGEGRFDCDECNGLCTVRCYTCGGSGKLECNDCRGEGLVECSDCRGEGKIECRTCRGKAEIDCTNRDCYRGKVDCDECRGRGEIKRTINGHTEYFKCRKCHGEKKITCDICGGRGKIWCEDCNHRGFFPCDTCDQRGKIKCRNCNGDGRVECTDCDRNNMVYCRSCGGDGYLRCRKCDSEGSLLTYVQLNEEIKIYTDKKILHAKGLPEELIKKLEKSFIKISDNIFPNEQEAIEKNLEKIPDVIKSEMRSIMSERESSNARNLEYQLIEEGVDLYELEITFKDKSYKIYSYGKENNFFIEESMIDFIMKELWKDFSENALNNKNTVIAYYGYTFLTTFAHEKFPNEETLFKLVKEGISDKCKDKIQKKQIKFIDKGCSFEELLDFIENGSKKTFSLFGKRDKENKKIVKENAGDKEEIVDVVSTPKKSKAKKKDKTVVEVSKKSRLLSLVLCVLLGWCDIHNFYVGKKIKGIIHIAIFVLTYIISEKGGRDNDSLIGLLFLIWLVMWGLDFILILFGRYKDGKKQRIKKWV